MSDSKDEEFINILVLGSSNVKISYFVKLFISYLKYDTLDEIMFYEPNLKTEVKNVKATTITSTRIGEHNIHFIETPGLQKSGTNYEEIIDILLHFEEACCLHAIILLIDPDKNENENYLKQYTTHFFSGMKQYTKNIVYIVLYNDSCMYNQTYRNLKEVMNITLNVAENLFHLNDHSYYKLSDSNWEESVNFSNDIYAYITGSNLKSFYVQCVLPPEESFLKLIYNLNVILLLICFLVKVSETEPKQIYIKEYKQYTTVCFGLNCQTEKKIENCTFQQIVPKICHNADDCIPSILEVERCLVFQTHNRKCSLCNCDAIFHRSFFVIFDSITPTSNIKHEQLLAKSTLIQLIRFINCYDSMSINNFITKALSGASNYTRDILRDIRVDLEKDIAETCVPHETLVMTIYKLYRIKELTSIFPKVINENFPHGLRLEIVTKHQGQNQGEPKESRSYKTKHCNMKRELDELKLRFEQRLETTSSKKLSKHHHCKKQNCKKLNTEEYTSASSPKE